MKHFFIVNPAAGKGNQINSLTQKAHSVCRKAGVEYEIHTTTEPGEATAYVKKICEREFRDETLRFYACGGDGTLNEVVCGAYGYDNAQVAVVPIGTGNDFIRNFGTVEQFMDLESQITANTVRLDLLRMNDRLCVNVINIGFDCDVVERTGRIKRSPLVPGKLAYVVGVVGEFVEMQGVQFRCTVDGEELGDRKTLLALFANGQFYGGGFRPAPYASVSDGLMDVCFIKYVKRTTFVRRIMAYKAGRHMLDDDCREIFEYRKCREVVLEFPGQQRYCVDGELFNTRKLTLSIIPGAFNFVIPASAKCAYEPVDKSPYVVG